MESFFEVYFQVLFCIFMFIVTILLGVLVFWLGKLLWEEIKEGL